MCSTEPTENLDNIVFTTLTTLRRGDCYVSATYVRSLPIIVIIIITMLVI